ncbi:MAG: response regulator [Boseongicola sp.]|nr:MAG: response regulator [Boseongicola sp.]
MKFEGRHIALVEDDEIMGGSLVHRLELEGARISWLKTHAVALGAIRTPYRSFDAVVSDIKLPDGDGGDLYQTLCDHGNPPPFLFITGHGEVEQAVKLMRSGASDYFVKPFEMDVFLDRLAQILPSRLDNKTTANVGVSDVARHVETEVARAAALDLPVLIKGELGTGKGLLAEAIHYQSARKSAEYQKLDFARIPEEKHATVLTEMLEKDTSGTLLLSVVSSASANAQAHLLNTLDAGKLPMRIIASAREVSSNTDQGADLRMDLSLRLSAFEIRIPPLRERPEDAVWLLHRFFDHANALEGMRLDGISAQCFDAVQTHPLPGNGAELKARVKRAVALSQSRILMSSDLFPELAEKHLSDVRQETVIRPLASTRAEAEKTEIQRALAAADGHVSEAAKMLNISRTTLWEKMQRYKL